MRVPSAPDMLAAPRGRRFCLEVALAAEPAVASVVADAERAFLPDDGSVGVLRATAGDDHAVAPPVGIAEVARALRGIRTAAVDEVLVDDAAVLACLERTVTGARYWQPPDERDMLAAQPEVRVALAAVVERIVVDGVLARWRASSFGSGWHVEFDGGGGEASRSVPPAVVLSAWREETLREEARRRDAVEERGASGTWWSFPLGLPTVSDAFAGVPCGLALVEDPLGWDRALVTGARGAGRVLDLDEAGWVELCRRHPLDVTASRGADWGRATGREGAWVIPDWAEVAHEWSAVRLSIAKYLVLAGRPLMVDAERASLVAGWGPGVTRWLTDGVRLVGEPREWVREPTADGDARWVPAAPPHG